MLPGRPPSQWCLCVGLAVLGAIAILGLLLAIFALAKTGPNQHVVFNPSGTQKGFLLLLFLITFFKFSVKNDMDGYQIFLRPLGRRK